MHQDCEDATGELGKCIGRDGIPTTSHGLNNILILVKSKTEVAHGSLTF